MSTYILLKDLPDLDAGSEFTYNEFRDKYLRMDGADSWTHEYGRHIIETTPDWFKLKEEKVWTDSDMMAFGKYLNPDISELHLLKYFNSFKG